MNPRDSAARFKREFEEEYGEHELPFSDTGYAAALDAAKKDLKFLLVILMSPEHDDTSSWTRDTLLSPQVVSFVKDPANNIILWAGNVQDSEAYQVSTALRCTKFPFSALIVHTPRVSSTAMSVVARIGGVSSPNDFIAKLRAAIASHREALDNARSQRTEREAERSLRAEQESAYERSLATDRERARQRREAEAAAQRAEKEAQEKAAAAEKEAQNRDQWKRWRAQSIPDEPSTEVKEVTRISLRMPSGKRVVRRFRADADMEELYAFVECFEVISAETEFSEKPVEEPVGFDHAYEFVLVSPMPRVVYDLKSGGTVGESLGRSGNLIVERVDEDEDEDEDHA